MQLLHLADGGVSLEFSQDEKPFVMRRLSELGPVSIQREATYDLISVRAERLIYLDEWDEPCLIAASAAAKALLAEVARGSSLSVAAE